MDNGVMSDRNELADANDLANVTEVADASVRHGKNGFILCQRSEEWLFFVPIEMEGSLRQGEERSKWPKQLQ